MICRTPHQNRWRVITKTVIYRLLMLALTVGITWLLVGNINEALNIGIAISALKTVIYYLYERTWDHITLGMPS
jgi:uncharacterized membrane protein